MSSSGTLTLTLAPTLTLTLTLALTLTLTRYNDRHIIEVNVSADPLQRVDLGQARRLVITPRPAAARRPGAGALPSYHPLDPLQRVDLGQARP